MTFYFYLIHHPWSFFPPHLSIMFIYMCIIIISHISCFCYILILYSHANKMYRIELIGRKRVVSRCELIYPRTTPVALLVTLIEVCSLVNRSGPYWGLVFSEPLWPLLRCALRRRLREAAAKVLTTEAGSSHPLCKHTWYFTRRYAAAGQGGMWTVHCAARSTSLNRRSDQCAL